MASATCNDKHVPDSVEKGVPIVVDQEQRPARIAQPTDHAQRLLCADQDDELLSPRHCRIEQVSLKHHVVLSMERNDDARELRPLRLVDRQDIGQSDLVQIPEVVFCLPTLEIDHHLLLDAVDGFDQPEIAVENVPIIVVFRLDYAVPEAERPAKSLDFWPAVAGIEGRLQDLV